jgi:hypothetical protein
MGSIGVAPQYRRGPDQCVSKGYLMISESPGESPTMILSRHRLTTLAQG